MFLHELSHAKSGAQDVTRAFESELTNVFGVIGAQLVKNINLSQNDVNASLELQQNQRNIKHFIKVILNKFK